ncbi:MAG: aryl-sulfate sulfotransferase [bacterium]
MKYLFCILLSVFVVISCNNTTYLIGTNDSSVDAHSFEEKEDTENDEQSALLNVKVEQNEKNVLSCRLTFNTQESKKISVRYFSKDHKGYEITEENETTDHYFFLWGMRAEREYKIEIYEGENFETPIATTQFKTGSLPPATPGMYLAINEKEKVADGFTLFTFSATIEEKAVPLALMVDTDGEVVWYFEYYMNGFNILGDLSYIEKSESILIGLTKAPNMSEIPAEEAIEIDLEGNVLWKSRPFPNVYGDEHSWHHTYQLLEDDTIVFLRSEFIGPLISDKIVNVNRDYDELWGWRYLDHLEQPFCTGPDWCDWTHSNTVIMLKNENTTYLNSRNMSSLFKIDMESGEILWTFGRDGGFVLSSDIEHPWFEYAHAPKIAGNKILFYDNGTFDRGFSRVIEYEVDFENLKAETTFSYDGSEDGGMWFSEYWGDADYLPNGNILVTAGIYDLSGYSRIFEITKEGEKVWDFFMQKEETWMYSLYNSQKFVPPLKTLD